MDCTVFGVEIPLPGAVTVEWRLAPRLEEALIYYTLVCLCRCMMRRPGGRSAIVKPGKKLGKQSCPRVIRGE